MSVQDLLQKDVKQVVGPNIRLLISSLPSEYTVEVKEKNIVEDESSPSTFSPLFFRNLLDN